MNTLGRNNLSIAILGPGAVGGFLAAVFWKNGIPVTCIAKPDSAAAINKDGIHLESYHFGNFTAYPKAVTQLKYKPNFLFITTKTFNLVEALQRISNNCIHNTVIIPLLNGIEHLQIIREALAYRVAAGMISGEFKKLNQNHITHSSPHVHIEIASDSDIPKNNLQVIAQLLSEIGLETQVLKREGDVVWRKLVRLNAIAVTTAASHSPVGFVRTNPQWRRKLENCVYEGAMIAKIEGTKINPKVVIDQIDLLPIGLSTSLQRDITKGLPSELDAIPGAILRLAEKHNISCPTIQSIFEGIKK